MARPPLALGAASRHARGSPAISSCQGPNRGAADRAQCAANLMSSSTGWIWARRFWALPSAATSLRRVARYGALIDVRRMIGVAAFVDIAAHLALFFADQSYSAVKFFTEITRRVYLIIGAIAWPGLAALAVTSTDAMVRRLGGRRVAATAPAHLCDRAARIDSLFPANQSRCQRADFCCWPVRGG